jgi:biotin carboxyl carrier protein
MPHAILRLLLWTAALLAVGGLLTGAYFVHQEMSAERAAESPGDRVESPRRAENRVVKLGESLARSLGIEEEPARAATWYETTTVYGRVVPNPRATFEVRSPFPGTLRAAEAPWPAPGRVVTKGQVIGRVDVRVGPQDRLDLLSKLNGARKKVEGADEAVKTLKPRFDRVMKSADVPPREKEEVRLALIEAETALATARGDVELWQGALDEIEAHSRDKSGTWVRPLTAPADGEVAELAGQPGTAVEAGGLVVKLVDFRRVLLRLDLPPEVLAGGAPAQVEASGATAGPAALRGTSNRPDPAPAEAALPAVLVGPAPQVDAASQWAGYLYEASLKSDAAAPGGALWRPGLFVRADVRPARAAPQEAVAVPAGALLYHQGRALVYVRDLKPGEYARREVQVLGRDGDRWLLAPRPRFAPAGVGLDPDELVVKSQPQVLLSEEFRIDVDND